MDNTYNNTLYFVLILLASLTCCPLVGFIFGIMGIIQCKEPNNKIKAIVVLVAALFGSGVLYFGYPQLQ